jgi:hypothetical protein
MIAVVSCPRRPQRRPQPAAAITFSNQQQAVVCGPRRPQRRPAAAITGAAPTRAGRRRAARLQRRPAAMMTDRTNGGHAARGAPQATRRANGWQAPASGAAAGDGGQVLEQLLPAAAIASVRLRLALRWPLGFCRMLPAAGQRRAAGGELG